MNITDISYIAEVLRHAKDRGQAGTLLIGAGCSVTAGIPLAGEFIKIIENEFPAAYKRAKKKTYPECMAQLLPTDRRHLISKYIDEAKINWAHIAIAQLMKCGYINRVLTTNFDPLVSRACALVGLYPAIYDLAVAPTFQRHLVSDKAIFHLHGQRTGFIILNTEDECNNLATHLEPVIKDSLDGKPFIIIGYSGDNDPVMEKIADKASYDGGLFWVCYKDNNPNKEVQDKILPKGKDGYCFKGHDADDFFVLLAQELDCFPPLIVSDPFAHLDETLSSVLPYTIPGQNTPITEGVRNLIKTYGDRFRTDNKIKLRVRELLYENKFDEVLAFLPDYEKFPSDELADSIYWAFIMQGNAFYEKAKAEVGARSKKLFKEASDRYLAAAKMKSEKYEALYNRGLALSAQALIAKGKEADKLFEEARERYADVLKIKPDEYWAFCDWGSTLDAQARTKTGKEADMLWKEADEKYATAVRVKPDSHETFYNWGNSLVAQARTKTGKEADRLWKEAGEKYAAVVKIKPDKHESFNNWGFVLDAQARTKTGKEADRLWKEAGEKYAVAVKIRPDKPDAFHNWGVALATQANITINKQQKARLKKLSEEKFAKAKEIHDKLNPAKKGNPQATN